MAVGPVLPWRAASGQLLRDRLLVPAWAGAITLVVLLIAGAHGIANVGAFALGAFALTSIGRTVVVGVRARKRASHRGAARRGGAHGAFESAAVRRLARTRRCGRGRDRARDDRRLHDEEDGRALGRRVGAGARLHRDVPRSAGRPVGAEDDDQGACPRERRCGRARTRDLDVPERGRGHRHAVDPHDAVPRLLPHSRVVADVRSGHDRRADRHDGDVPLDRRADHGARAVRSRSIPARKRDVLPRPTVDAAGAGGDDDPETDPAPLAEANA